MTVFSLSCQYYSHHIEAYWLVQNSHLKGSRFNQAITETNHSKRFLNLSYGKLLLIFWTTTELNFINLLLLISKVSFEEYKRLQPNLTIFCSINWNYALMQMNEKWKWKVEMRTSDFLLYLHLNQENKNLRNLNQKSCKKRHWPILHGWCANTMLLLVLFCFQNKMKNFVSEHYISFWLK